MSQDNTPTESMVGFDASVDTHLNAIVLLAWAKFAPFWGNQP